MIEAFQNIFRIPDLRKRVIFTFLLLAVYRVGAQIPTPGIDALALQEFFKQYASGVLGFVNLFSGGALARCTIFALGIMPYITASIIFQLLGVVWPYIEKLQKEGGAEGRKKITQYTRYATILICIVQAAGISVWLKNLVAPGTGHRIVPNPGLWYHISVVIILTAGSVFVMWLGEQITARGIGNGISLMIFAGIVVGLVPAIVKTFRKWAQGDLNLFVIVILMAFMLAVVAFIVYFERAQRKIPIQYAKRMVGRRMVGGTAVFFPLKLNPGGVMPIIFAVSLLAVPQTILQLPALSQYEWARTLASYFGYGSLTYLALYAVLIVLFAYFYISIVFNPDDMADNLKKYGGFIPGIRPGKSTSDFLYRSLNRLLFAGSIYLVIVALLPVMLISGLPLQHIWGIGPSIENFLKAAHFDWILRGFSLDFYFGGTSLLIVVGVAMDTLQQIESQLVMRNYEGFSRRSRLRGRRG
ncbi:MAG: preprotein translocase subunit SecY [Acidobacteria bacterium]|nr:preprotein translocase subunit SecY [Acidobacteriota bacterium]